MSSTMSSTKPSVTSDAKQISTRRARLRVGLVVVLLATFGIAACGGDDSDEETEQAGDTDQPTDATDESGDDGDNGDGGGGGGSEDCGGIEVPEGFASVFTENSCEFVECIFDRLDVSDPDEFQEKYGNNSDEMSPEQIGELSSAIAACASTLDTSG